MKECNVFKLFGDIQQGQLYENVFKIGIEE